MKTSFRLFVLFGLLVAAVRAADDRIIAAVRAADDERVAATAAADRARLEAIYSDGLHYAHSSGKIDTKASQIDGITGAGSQYGVIEYKERTFVPAGPGVVLMKGRALVPITNRKSGQKNILDLNYLAVWREEGGKWRFFAWQSCRNQPPGEAKK